MPKSVAETDFSWSIVHDLAMGSYVKGIIWIANVSQPEHTLLHPSNSVECPVRVEIVVVITLIKHTFFTIYGLLYPSEDLLRPSRINFPKRTSQDAATPHPIRGQNPTSQTVLQQPLPRLVSDTYSPVTYRGPAQTTTTTTTTTTKQNIDIRKGEGESVR